MGRLGAGNLEPVVNGLLQVFAVLALLATSIVW